MKISVLMSTYNREKLLGHMIECVVAQNFTDFEFIIVDNGSTDKTGAIADSYAQKDSRIKVIHKIHGNIGSGRNACLDAANGEYIAFVDDDDDIDKDYLEFLLMMAEKHNADIAICAAYGKEFDEENIMTPEDALITLFWRKKYNVQFPTKLIKTALLRQYRFSETDRFDDIGLMPYVFAGAAKIVYNGKPKYTFNRHETNSSSWTTNHRLLTPEILDEYLKTYKERIMFLTSKFPEYAKQWNYFRWSFMISMVEKIISLKLVECYPQCDNILDELKAVKNEFVGCPWILDFEREWVNLYV